MCISSSDAKTSSKSSLCLKRKDLSTNQAGYLRGAAAALSVRGADVDASLNNAKEMMKRAKAVTRSNNSETDTLLVDIVHLNSIL